MELRKGPSASGFSLLEVMIALSILAFGMLTATVGQISALKTSRQSRTQMLAMYLAEQQMEAFQAMTAADVLAATGDPNYPNDPANPIDPDPGDDDDVQFTRRWFIQQDTPEVGVISLRVEVDWVSPLGFARTTTLQSHKAEL
ncbi:MAG: prepilin-type N-terminal cleavage/methylation domain-containing protein [Myxococcota bacterium]